MSCYGGYALWDTYRIYQGAAVSDELLRYKPSETESEASFEELLALNPDVTGWLTIDGTHIDYPVVQGENDMEYINKDVYGNFALSGAIFLSSLNRRDFSDSYNLVYGHHMDHGAMFGDVIHLLEERYFQDHEKGMLYLPDRVYEITLFACMETDAYDRKIYDVEHIAAEGNDEITEYISQKALQKREAAGEKLIALSTCKQAESDERVILFGWLKEKEE